jgi:hypothetical protein
MTSGSSLKKLLVLFEAGAGTVSPSMYKWRELRDWLGSHMDTVDGQTFHFLSFKWHN